MATPNGHGLVDAEHRVRGDVIDLELGIRVAVCLFFENQTAYANLLPAAIDPWPSLKSRCQYVE